MDLYKYHDWQRVKEGGTVSLSVLQKELVAIMNVAGAIFKTKKKQRKIFTQYVRGSFTTSCSTLQVQICVRSERLGELMEENLTLQIWKAKSYRLLDKSNQEKYFPLYACPSLPLCCGQLVLATAGDRTLPSAPWLHASHPLISPHPRH